MKSLLHWAQEALAPLRARLRRLFCPPDPIPNELQVLIDGCRTMDELLALLFSTDFIKDEAIMAAFDRRIDELERTA